MSGKERVRTKSSPVMHKIMITYVILIMCMIGISTGYSLYTEIKALNREFDETLEDFSHLFSRDQRIREMVQAGTPDAEVTEFLDDMLLQLNKIDLIVIADEQARRLYHPEKERIGQQFVGGDESAILAGAAPYVTEGVGTRQFQRRAFTGIYDEDDTIIGFVMVSAYKQSIEEMQSRTITRGLMFAALFFVLALWLAWLLSRSIKKSLLGYEPAQIARLYLQKEEVLDTLEEGVLAIDQKGRCTLLNQAARRILCQDNEEDLTGQFIAIHLNGVTLSGIAEHNCEIEINGNAVLIDKIPILEGRRQVGVVCLLKNKTELQQLAEQLTGVNHIVEALRANTHEYVNKLHVVLGLLQIGDMKTAVDYIEHLKNEEQEDYSVVMNRIKNKTIAALIMGKKRRAKERDITLTLRKDSNLEAHNDFLSANDLVTIIGNLLENAMDAVDAADDQAVLKQMREISLYIGNFTDHLSIQVDDTGSGMTLDQIDKITTGRYSSKGEGRGVGLHLVQAIVERCEGDFDIESEPGEGSSFVIFINKKRRRH